MALLLDPYLYRFMTCSRFYKARKLDERRSRRVAIFAAALIKVAGQGLNLVPLLFLSLLNWLDHKRLCASSAVLASVETYQTSQHYRLLEKSR